VFERNATPDMAVKNASNDVAKRNAHKSVRISCKHVPERTHLKGML
jgi:hypothetical protein